MEPAAFYSWNTRPGLISTSSALFRILNLIMDKSKEDKSEVPHVTGHANFFSVKKLSSSKSMIIRHDVEQGQRILPSKLDLTKVHFIDNVNHINYSTKAQGTLVALEQIPTSKSSTSTFNLGFIVSLDTSFKLALLNNSTCFFQPSSNKLHNFFNFVKNSFV